MLSERPMECFLLRLVEIHVGTSSAPVSREILVEAVAAHSIGVPQVMDMRYDQMDTVPGDYAFRSVAPWAARRGVAGGLQRGEKSRLALQRKIG